MSTESRVERRAGAIRRTRTFAILTVLGVAALMVVLWMLKGERLDHQGCLSASGPSREVVVLVDTSDPLSDKHKAELRRILREMTSPVASGNHEALAVKEGERVTLYHLESTGGPERLVVQICHPGNPAERPWFEALIEGRVFADRRWQDFRKGLEDEVEKLFPGEEAAAQPASPILEALAVIAARHASSRRAEKDSKPTHLIIISDLLQNTGMLSHYMPYPNPEEIPRELRTDLSRVEVSLFRLERHKYESYQTPEHYYWWTDWVEAMGGKMLWQQAL